MSKKQDFKTGGGPVLSATCINVMARYVQVARREEGIDLHLQDRNILNKISKISEHTNNKRLKLLHQRLLDEVNSHGNTDAVGALTKNTEPAVAKRNVLLSDRLRNWANRTRR